MWGHGGKATGAVTTLSKNTYFEMKKGNWVAVGLGDKEGFALIWETLEHIFMLQNDLHRRGRRYLQVPIL